MSYKISLCFIIILSIITTTSAQSIFNGPIKVDSLYWTTSVSAADMDGDGDNDLLAVSYTDIRGIVWYENINGKGTFSGSRLIVNRTTNASLFMEACAVDLDGDGDLDVVSANEAGLHRLTWFENIDGRGAFGEVKSVAPGIASSNDLFVADLDGDGDADILPALGKLLWFENTNGLGNFSNEKIIDNNTTNIVDTWAVDLDDDGDQDIITANNNEITWYENTNGKGTFSAGHIITTAALGAWSVCAADINGDGAMDIISASRQDDKVAWYQNLDGKGSFSNEKIITTIADDVISVHAADLDMDGDIDVLSASVLDNKISWYENLNGQGTFGNQIVLNANAQIATSVNAADLDGDGDLDVLSTSEGNHLVAWYRNLTISSSIREKPPVLAATFQLYQNYPNPFNGATTINFTLATSQHVTIEVFDILGRKIATLLDEEQPAGKHTQVFNAAGLQSGVYLCKMKAANEIQYHKMVLLQ